MARPLRAAAGSAAAILALSLDRRNRDPLAVQLARQLRQMILAGRIAPGARLPSSRVLCDELGVSRATVVDAVGQLTSEGYVEGRHGSGVYVSSALPEQVLQVRPSAMAPARSAAVRRSSARPPAATRAPARPFLVGAADPELLPLADWARRFARIWRAPSPELTGPLEPFGHRPLRLAIARHLEAWRGIVADPDRIAITSGTADATDIIVAAAALAGSAAWVEEPGYPSLRHALERHCVRIRPVPVDEDGLDPQRAPVDPAVRAAIVTPSRQFPLGGTLPVARRLALLEWAERADGFVVEDDFDSEYRYEGTPLPALTGLDTRGRTIYVGSFSKTLMPSLRLGFLVLPEGLADAARRHVSRRGALASLMMQPVLADYMASGEYATHIRRSRRIYARRLAAMLAAGDRLEGVLVLRPTTSGMHVVADLGPRLAGRLDDRRVAEVAAADGIVVAPLTDYYAGPPTRRAVLLGFAGFPEEALVRAMHRLADVLARA